MTLNQNIEQEIGRAGMDPARIVVDQDGKEHTIGLLMEMLPLCHEPGTTAVHVLTTKDKANVLYDEDAYIGQSKTYTLKVLPDGTMELTEVPTETDEPAPYEAWSTWDLSEEVLWIASYGWHRSNPQKWDEGKRRFQGGWKVYVIRNNEPVCIMKNQMTSQLKKFLMEKIAPRYKLGPIGSDMADIYLASNFVKSAEVVSGDVYKLRQEMNYQKKCEGRASYARLDGYAPRQYFAFQMIRRNADS